jgi:phage protein D
LPAVDIPKIYKKIIIVFIQKLNFPFTISEVIKKKTKKTKKTKKNKKKQKKTKNNKKKQKKTKKNKKKQKTKFHLSYLFKHSNIDTRHGALSSLATLNVQCKKNVCA